MYTGLKSLDDIVYKFLFGSVIIVTGQRGNGKSSLVNQTFICEPLNQGYDVFAFSGELSSPVLKSWIELTMAGTENIKMKDGFVHIIEPNARATMREWYKGRVSVYSGASNHIDSILDKAISVTRKNGVKVWILDNLMTMDIGANDNNLLQKQKDLIVRLTGLALQYGVLIVLIAHPRKLPTGVELSGDDVSGSGDMANLCQYLLSVKRFSQKEKDGEKDNKGGYRKGKEPIDYDTEIKVIKNRYTGKIGEARVYFDYPSYRFHSQPNELYKRYKWNKCTAPIPNKYPENFKRQPDFLKD